jgi:hypothetical protein
MKSTVRSLYLVACGSQHRTTCITCFSCEEKLNADRRNDSLHRAHSGLSAQWHSRGRRFDPDRLHHPSLWRRVSPEALAKGDYLFVIALKPPELRVASHFFPLGYIGMQRPSRAKGVPRSLLLRQGFGGFPEVLTKGNRRRGTASAE